MLFERRIRVKVKFNMKMPIFHVLSSDYDECSSFFIAKAGKKFAFPKWNVINLYRRRCLNCVHCSIASKMHLWGDFYLYKTDHFFLTHRNACVQFQMMRFFFQTRKKSMHWKKQSSIRKKGEQLKFGLCCTLSENGTRTSERYRVWHPLSGSIYDQLLCNFYLLSMFEMWIMLRDAWHL